MMNADDPHLIHRVGWLRAAVLGANDGIVSTASLVIGVAAAEVEPGDVLTAGVAGLVAGALSMAAGEYVSVSSQADLEAADLERERRHLAGDREGEHQELAQIYEDRGLDPDLARQVADQLMEHDALAAHARDELGITEQALARPLLAALSSAAAFAAGAALPLIALLAADRASIIPMTGLASVAALALLGALSARAGGAPIAKAVFRLVTWGVLAMVVTAMIGSTFAAL
jgi:vacuolar iron transporter family protein